MTAKKIEPGRKQAARHGVETLSATGISTARWVFIHHSHLWRPPTDLYEIEEAYVIQVEVAGMSAVNFEISVQDRRATVHGVRPDPGGARAYHQMEIRFGEFRTEVELPGPVERAAATAEYQDGYLKLVLPKRSPRRIDVK